MDQTRLWAPWRLGYVQGDTVAEPVAGELAWRPGADHDCFLCRAAAVEPCRFRGLGVVERTPLSLVITNRYPYSNGHLLVAPLDHHASLGDLADDVLLDLQRRIAAWCGRMTRAMQAHGFNVGLNLGAVAGAGVPGHLHWHVVPRWPGDVNFMPAIAGVRVLPQSLDALWEQLTRAAAEDAA
ncbi:MAG: HIT domain-containing protein [Planctomycetaceae bacterium]